MADSDQSINTLRYNQITSGLEGFGGGSPQWTPLTLTNTDPTQVPVTRLINTTAPLTGGGNLSADRTLAIPAATGSVNGYLLAVDWTTFNAKQNALTLGNLTDAGIDGITITNGTSAVVGTGTSLSQHVADASHNGYLSSTDWSTFNAKQAAGNYITALTGDATATGPGSAALTLATVNANVGSFTVSSVTVNAKGLITAASSGTTGNLTDAGTDGITITNGTSAVLGTGTSLSQHVSDATHNGYLASADWSTFNSKQAAGNYITALTGDVTATGPGSVASTLATVNGNVGSFTYASITVNAKGLITAASSGTAPVTSVSGTANQITSTGGATPVLAIANPVTFPGAMTAGGALAMASNKITGLANGTTATDAAAFGQIPVTTNFASYTPTIVGCGTVTNNTAYWRQVGNHVFVKGYFTTGTVTSTSVTISLPNSTVINTAEVPANGTLGLSWVLTSSGTPALLSATGSPTIFTDGSTNSTVFLAIQSVSGGFVKNQGGQIFVSGYSFSYQFDYPI